MLFTGSDLSRWHLVGQVDGKSALLVVCLRTPSFPFDRFCLLFAAPRRRSLDAGRGLVGQLGDPFRDEITWAGVTIQRREVDADALQSELLDRVYAHAKALAEA